jgi:hypothetical protein
LCTGSSHCHSCRRFLNDQTEITDAERLLVD